jgi:hypothetical protein
MLRSLRPASCDRSNAIHHLQGLRRISYPYYLSATPNFRLERLLLSGRKYGKLPDASDGARHVGLGRWILRVESANPMNP